MKLKHPLIILLFAFLIFSCKNNKKKTIEKENPDTELPSTTNTAKTGTDAFVANLQGKWKEAEYPYRTAEFKGNEVKFVEEGVVDPPAFEAYLVTTTCSGMQEKANNREQPLTYLYLPEKKLCQNIKVSEGQLILTGTTQDYRIVYDKIE